MFSYIYSKEFSVLLHAYKIGLVAVRKLEIRVDVSEPCLPGMMLEKCTFSSPFSMHGQKVEKMQEITADGHSRFPCAS